MSVPPLGAQIAGKYVLHRVLGRGGYGAVYEGENLDIGKRVAIKVIDKRHARSKETSERFRREARATARIESDHIVQVFDVGDDPILGLYMVMEMLKGEDLRHKLDRVGHIDVEFAVDVAHQIACGLARAHAAGVIHRDLKPANVFLHEREAEPTTVKLVDFGVSKVLADDERDPDKLALTTAGKTMGTPQYMSPEQVQGHAVDHRTDVWALGALLYEMIAGRPAYANRDTFQETAVAIVLEKPAPLASVADWVPPEIAAIVAQAMNHDLKERFTDANAFADALMEACPEAFVDGRGQQRVADVLASHPRSVSRPTPQPVSATAKTDPIFIDGKPVEGAFTPDPPASDVSTTEGVERMSLPAGVPRSGARSWLFVLALLCAATAAVFVVVRQRRAADAARDEKPWPVASQTKNNALPVPISAIGAGGPTFAAMPAASGQPSAAHDKTKPGAVTSKPGAPSASTSTSASTSPSASGAPSAVASSPAPEGSEGQFGAVGVSSAY